MILQMKLAGVDNLVDDFFADIVSRLVTVPVVPVEGTVLTKDDISVLKVGEAVLSAIVVGLVGAPVEPLDGRVPVLPHPVSGHVVVVVAKVAGTEPELVLKHRGSQTPLSGGLEGGQIVFGAPFNEFVDEPVVEVGAVGHLGHKPAHGGAERLRIVMAHLFVVGSEPEAGMVFL